MLQPLLREPAGCIDETNLTLFVENRLTESATRSVIEAHLDTCETCRSLVGQLATQAAGSGGTTATRIDRYIVISELGAGAMGRVFLASDPELDRRVAIKLLRHVDMHGEHDARLRREAQALARVAHPNVAAIFDVGELDDHLFLAMEYVPGGTLKAWLAAAPRSWREIVRVFEGAARGLAAVHACGLVHRDFKPDNVLLDDRGAAKVTDFGLVSIDERGSPPRGSIAEARCGVVEAERSSGLADSDPVDSLTATGAVLGTPAYMAPEQLAGGVVDARSDQFGFCVALYEALQGERPFQGATVAEIKRAYETTPKRGALPRWLHRLLVRGLAITPAARFASMDELAIALSPARRTRRRLAGAGAAGIVLAGATIAFAATRTHAAACTGATDLDSVWNPAARQRLDQAFASTRAPFAADVSRSVTGVLDRYAARWRVSYTEVCEATRVRGTQSVAMMDRRTSCLASREHELATLVDVLDHATPAVAEHALDLAALLPAVERCDDPAAAPAGDPMVRGVRSVAEATRVRAEAAMDVGQFAEAERETRELAAAAAMLHDPALAIQAELVRAKLEASESKQVDAAATYERAIADADRNHDDFDRAWAWAKRVHVLADAGKVADAEAEIPLAQAAVDRAGATPDLAELWDTARATVLYLRGHIEPANKLYSDAIARARARSDRRSISELLHANAIAIADTSDPAHSLALETESLALATELYGPRHPQIAVREREISHLLGMEHKDPEALAKIQDAYAILLGAYGPDDAKTAVAEISMAHALHHAGRLVDARTHASHALATLRAQTGDQHYYVADALRALALIERAAKNFKKALAYQKEAHAILEANLGPDTDGLIASFQTLAELDRDLAKPRDAETDLRAGLAIGERTAPHNPQLGLLYAELGELRVEAHDGRAAVPLYQRAIAQLAGSAAHPQDLAFARLDLAHVEADLGAWHEARELALAAKPGLEAPEDLAGAQQVIDAANKH
jgi:hypothetical protein